MSRFDGELRPSAETPLSLPELLDLLAGHPQASDQQRQQAIACFLSGSDGWKEAVKSLGGAFASEAATRLSADKGE